MSDAAPAHQPPTPRTPGEALEASLPGWQQRLNRFAENWIFAFLVAMAIRHVFLEAFQIPSASMEPMLYGDPRFMQRDFVVVDKFISRFRTPQRWDVTVFQFPLPELQGTGGRETDDAYGASGQRRDIPFVKPLMYRNFVKRAVVLPGDRFHIANGDVMLEQPDGSWAPAPRPTAVRDAMLDEIYRHGGQEEHDRSHGRARPGGGVYLPWTGSGGASAAADGPAIGFTLAGGEVQFSQPLRNLYVKPGKILVRARVGRGEDRFPVVRMTAPEFEYELNGATVTGSIWDMNAWQLYRITNNEDVASRHQTDLNRLADEFVGDIRFRFTVARMQGTPVIRLSEGTINRSELRLSPAGWALVAIAADGAETVHDRGGEDLTGKALALINVDDRLSLTIDGVERPGFAVRSANPQVDRLRLAVAGQGALTLAGLAIDRDVHYCVYADSILNDLATELVSDEPLHKRMRRDIRARWRYGKAYDDLLATEQAQVDRGFAWGNSPQTAVTAPAGAYLLLGDNSPHSWDGRSWGFVPEMNLRGRVLAVVMWPWRWHVVR